MSYVVNSLAERGKIHPLKKSVKQSMQEIKNETYINQKNSISITFGFALGSLYSD